jgi:predicted TIM-barrel fold metal-dependent hydrolase
MAALMAVARPGHVLFGTDWPYAAPRVIDHFRAEFAAYPFAPGERESVARTAATQLFPRLESG